MGLVAICALACAGFLGLLHLWGFSVVKGFVWFVLTGAGWAFVILLVGINGGDGTPGFVIVPLVAAVLVNARLN